MNASSIRFPTYRVGWRSQFTSVPEHVAVMYFNTNYPHSDVEMLEYDRQPFRQYRGRTGVIDARYRSSS